MMRNILVGYDGSEAAVHALTFARNWLVRWVRQCTYSRSCARPSSAAWLRQRPWLSNRASTTTMCCMGFNPSTRTSPSRRTFTSR
jgi:hypothetical protein